MKVILNLLLIMIMSLPASFAGDSEPEKKRSGGLDGLRLDLLELPPGFTVEVYASDVENARSMTLGPQGRLFVGTRGGDEVYALVDKDGDNFAETKYTIADELWTPNGVAIHNGDLYVAEINRILCFPDIENNLGNDLSYEVVYDTLPDETHHG